VLLASSAQDALKCIEALRPESVTSESAPAEGQWFGVGSFPNSKHGCSQIMQYMKDRPVLMAAIIAWSLALSLAWS